MATGKAALQAELEQAIEAGDAARVEALLAQRVNVNQKGEDEQVPLERALNGGHPDVVRLLLAAGANPNKGGFYEPVPLALAAALGDEASLDLLLAAGAELERRNKGGATALGMAAQRGHAHVVQRLLDAGADPSAVDLQRRHAASVAAQAGHEAVFTLLAPLAPEADRTAAAAELRHTLELQRREQDVAGQALIEASAEGDLAKVKAALAAGAGVDARDRWGRTPLHHAANFGRLDVAQHLLSAGADPDVRDELLGYPPIAMSPIDAKLDVVRALAAAGSTLNAPTREGTSLLERVAHAGQVEVVRLLLELGAEPLGVPAEEWLAYAERTRPPAGVDVKIAWGNLDTSIRVRSDYDALEAARKTRPALPKPPRRTAAERLRDAVAAGDAAAVRRAIAAKADPNALYEDSGTTPLGEALEQGSLEVVQALLAAGARPDHGGIVAPLYEAASAGRLDLVNALLDAGAELEQQDEEGETALVVAVTLGHIDVARRLVAAGADVTAVDAAGVSVLRRAARSGQSELFACLASAATPEALSAAQGGDE